MADVRERDRPQPHQLQVHPQHRYETGVKALLPRRGPSTSQILAIITLLPVGGTLLALAGLTLVGTLIGLAITTPLFVICSPVLVPAAITLGLAVTGFLTSGAFGLTGLSSLSWILNYFRQAVGSVPEQMDYAKKRMQDVAVTMGQKTKDVGQTMENKAREGGRETGREAART